MEIKKKKIILAITKSNWGGASRYVFDIATNLDKDLYDVSVLCGGKGILSEKLRMSGIKTISLPYMQRDIKIFDEIRGLFDLIDLFRKEKPDVIHLNSSKMGGLGALAGRIAGVKKIIFTAHGWPFWEDRNFISKSLIFFFSWLTAIFSHKVIVISNYDLSVAKKMPFIKNKLVRIYNGIAPMQFGSGNEIREAFSKGAHIIGTIGELTKNKNQISLIEQAKKDPSMYVAVVGEGEDRQFLVRKIEEYKLQDRVKMFGFRDAKNVLKDFDEFALPSIKEGLPYVLLEAKMAGLPIIANRVGGVPEILDAKDLSEFSLETFLKKTEALYNY